MTQDQKLAQILYRTRKNEVQLIQQTYGSNIPANAAKICEEDEKLLRKLEEKYGCGKQKGT